MATLEKRVQVLFSVEQYARLEAEAAAEGMSVGAYIRDSVDRRIERHRSDRSGLWDRIFARADALPAAGPVDWDAEKDAFDQEILRETAVEDRQVS